FGVQANPKRGSKLSFSAGKRYRDRPPRPENPNSGTSAVVITRPSGSVTGAGSGNSLANSGRNAPWGSYFSVRGNCSEKRTPRFKVRFGRIFQSFWANAAAVFHW